MENQEIVAEDEVIVFDGEDLSDDEGLVAVEGAQETEGSEESEEGDLQALLDEHTGGEEVAESESSEEGEEADDFKGASERAKKRIRKLVQENQELRSQVGESNILDDLYPDEADPAATAKWSKSVVDALIELNQTGDPTVSHALGLVKERMAAAGTESPKPASSKASTETKATRETAKDTLIDRIAKKTLDTTIDGVFKKYRIDPSFQYALRKGISERIDLEDADSTDTVESILADYVHSNKLDVKKLQTASGPRSKSLPASSGRSVVTKERKQEKGDSDTADQKDKKPKTLAEFQRNRQAETEALFDELGLGDKIEL